MSKSYFEIANELNTMPLEKKVDLYTKLGICSQECGTDIKGISNCKNRETYRAILNKNVLSFVGARLEYNESNILIICKKYPNLVETVRVAMSLSDSERDELKILKSVDRNVLERALGMFDMGSVDTESKSVDEVSDDFDDKRVNGEDLKETVKDDDEKVNTNDLSEEVMSEVRNLVNSIISVFDKFYAPLTQKRVSGILTDIGCYDIEENEVITTTAIACKTLLNGIKEATGYKLKSAKIGENINGKLIEEGVTYFPQISADILSMRYKSGGRVVQDKTWVEYRPHLRDLLEIQIKYIVSGYGLEKLDTDDKMKQFFNLRNKIRKIYSTAFVVEKFEASSEFEMRIISEDVQNTIGYEALGKRIAKGELSKIFSQESSGIEILANKNLDKNIHKYLFVLDNENYSGQLLFAYKGMEEILKGGGKLGYSNTLIGKALDGEHFTINLAAKQNIVTLIAAGSRSGKGVLTMNICGTLVASGVPIVYLDYKPDMACTFWDLERKKGCRMLAIDSLTGYGNGTRPVRGFEFGYNAPSYITDNSDFADVNNGLKSLPYLRGMQLMMGVSQALSAGIIKSPSKRMIFILDEAQAFAKDLNLVASKFDDLLKTLKPKKNEEPSEEYLYVNRLCRCIKKMSTQKYLNTTAGMSGVGCLILGQQAEISNWAKAPNDCIYNLVANCQQKILGRNAANGSSVYSLGAASGSVDGEKYANERTGYFAYVPTNKPGKESGSSIKVFKSYMTLNTNDAAPSIEQVETNSGNCVSTLLSNIVDPVLKENASKQLYGNDGLPESRVGFEGMMEFIAAESGISNIWEMAGLGYQLCLQLTDLLGITGPNGKYSCIEEWMYDCSFESLNSYDDIEMAITKGYKLFDSDYDNSTESEHFLESDIPDEISSKASMIGTQDTVNVDNLNPSVVKDLEGANVDYSRVRLSESDVNRMNEAKNLMFSGMTDDFDDELIEYGEDEPVEEYDFDNMEDKLQSVAEDGLEQREYTSPEINIEPYMNEPATEVQGKTGREIIIKPSKTNKVHRLNDENSICVSMEDYCAMENRAFKLFKTIEGSEMEFFKRWDAVLNGISKKIAPGLVTRVIIGDDCMYVNKKLIHMSGILGGIEDIRMEDIVNFGKTFKKFPNIKEITLSGTIFEAAQNQLGNPFMMLFEMGSQLNMIQVIESANSEPIVVKRRDLAEATSAREQASQLIKEARFKNQYEAASASMSNKLDRQTPGYKRKVYKVAEGSSKLSGNSFKAASASWSGVQRNFKKKQGVKTVLWGGALLLTGAAGAILGITGWAGKKLGK